MIDITTTFLDPTKDRTEQSDKNETFTYKKEGKRAH